MNNVVTPEPEPTATPHEKYVKRLRARLARPEISVEEARDGMLDCLVSTYHEGVKSGLKGILGIDASPDDVARTAANMFRKKLRDQGVTFEAPTLEALSEIKNSVDDELHFEELPAEVAATHDQVCSLLLSKAEGTLEHTGDQSALKKPSPSPAVSVKKTTSDAWERERAARASDTNPEGVGVGAPLRLALSEYLEHIKQEALKGAPAQELDTLIGRAIRLVDAVREFEE